MQASAVESQLANFAFAREVVNEDFRFITGADLHGDLLAVGRDARKPELAGLDVETVEGDLLDRASLWSALKGCDTLFHAAADYRLWTRNPADMYAANVQGTENILEEALAAGLRAEVRGALEMGEKIAPADDRPRDQVREKRNVREVVEVALARGDLPPIHVHHVAQRHEAEESREVLVVRHVADAVDEDQQPDETHHHHHHRRERIEHPAEFENARLAGCERQPFEIENLSRLRSVMAERVRNTAAASAG